MSTLDLLAPYIQHNLSEWHKCSKAVCRNMGITLEADDILGDALLELCQKENGVLVDLLECSEAGDKKLCHYVRKIVMCNALRYKERKYKPTCDIDDKLRWLKDRSDDESCGDISDAVRETEAMLRDDSFAVPTFPVKTNNKALYSASRVVHLDKGKKGDVWISVDYRIHIYENSKVVKTTHGNNIGVSMMKQIEYQCGVAAN